MPKTSDFKLNPLELQEIQKRRRTEKDARIHMRLSALLWLDAGQSADDVASLLDITTHTIRNWLALFRQGGLALLCSLQYKGDPG
jgi:transposase